MQTDTYANLATLVKGLTGNTTFTTDESTLVASFINRRIFQAYRRSIHWPRYLTLEELRTATDDTVPFTQSGRDSIDTFLRIYDVDPYGTSGSVTEYDFATTADGARVLGGDGTATTFYVDYKKRWAGPYNDSTNDDIPLEFFHYATRRGSGAGTRQRHGAALGLRMVIRNIDRVSRRRRCKRARQRGLGQRPRRAAVAVIAVRGAHVQLSRIQRRSQREKEEKAFDHDLVILTMTFTRVTVVALSTTNSHTSPAVTAVVKLESVRSSFFCALESVGFSLPAIVLVVGKPL